MPHTVRYCSEVPVVRDPDVLVVGGGPAGFAAAIAARRLGAEVVLAERWGQVGGVATMSLVNVVSAARTLDGGVTFPGATAELIQRMRGRGPQAIHGEGEGVVVHVDQLSYCMMEMLLAEGVELWLQTAFIDALCDEQRIAQAVVHNKSGLLALEAETVVDCTGDGDVAWRAGVPFTKGRPDDGRVQPASVMAEVGGVDVPTALQFNNRPVTLAELGISGEQATALVPPGVPGFDLDSECLPLPQNRVLFVACPRPGEVVLNMTRVLDCDGTRGEDVSRAEVIARRQMTVVVDLLRAFVPGFEHATLQRWSAGLGVRQTRSITGAYTLTAADVLGPTRFDDWVAFGSYPVDVHSPDGGGVRWEVPERTHYEIPYRCLVPEGCGNLLVAGRAISADHEALASARIMGTCASTGQAAGVAAALAARRGCPPAQVPAGDVQSGLAEAFEFRRL